MQFLSAIINLFLFLSASFFVFYIPGSFIIHKVNTDLEDFEIVSLSICAGIVFFVLIGAFFGVIHTRFLTLPTIILINILTFCLFRLKVILNLRFLLKKRLLIILLFLGILVQGFISFPSGYLYKDGLNFWSSQGFDGFWHISLMEEIRKQFPPQIPVFAGEQLVNYHFLSDILMGEFARIFPFFSSLDLYFRFFPVIYSFLMGLGVFAFVNKWKNEKIAYLAVFFTYFCGSFGYIVTYLHEGKIFGGETVFWAAQLNTVIANPPHAVAISMLLAFLLSLLIFLEKRKKEWFLITLFLAIIIAGFKVSSGVVLLAGLGAGSLLDFILYRKKSTLYLFILLSAANFITIKLMTRGVEGYLIFSPWWFVRTMVVEKLGLIDWENRRQFYISKGTWHAWLRVLQLEGTAFLIFLVGNLGMRTIGFLDLFRKIFNKKEPVYKNTFEITLVVMMITGFVIPMFFLQKGIVYNTIQFIQYFLLFFGFFAATTAYYLSTLFKNKIYQFLLIFIIILFSIPTVIGNFVEFYGPGRSALALVSNDELGALAFLKSHSQENDVILTAPFDGNSKFKYKSLPLPISAWNSTGYVSSLTSRRTYLSSEDMVIQTGFDNEKRATLAKNFFMQQDSALDIEFLNNNSISYIYLPKDEMKNPIYETQSNLNKVYENSSVVIYKVNKTS